MERTRRGVTGLQHAEGHTQITHCVLKRHKAVGLAFQIAALCACLKAVICQRCARFTVTVTGVTQTQAWAQCYKRRWLRTLRTLMLPSGHFSRLQGQQEPTFCASFLTVASRQTSSCICLRPVCCLAATHSFPFVVALSCMSARFISNVRLSQMFCFTALQQVLCQVHTLSKSDCLEQCHSASTVYTSAALCIFGVLRNCISAVLNLHL